MPEVKGAPSSEAPQQQQQKPQEGEEKKDPPQERSYSQAEMDRITAKVRKNAARDAELRIRREQGSRQEDPPADRQQQPQQQEEQEPKRDDFDTFEEHQRALAAYEGRKATREELAKAKEEDRKKAEREQHEKAATTWKGKIEQAQAKHADFETVLEEHDDIVELIGNSPMRGFVAESDIGPQIIYELCKNGAEAKRIAALPAYKQAAEIAKIEDKLIAAAAKPKEEEEDPDPDETPEAKEARETLERDKGGRFQKKDPPEPIEPGSGRPANNSALPSDKDDPETWRRKELARVRKREGK